MTALVESIKRLFEKEKLSLEQVGQRVEKGTIDSQEYKYITGREYGNGNA